MYLPHRIAGDSATAVSPAKQCFFYVDVSKQLVGVKLTWLEEREEWKYDRTVLVDEVLLVQPDCVEL